PKFLGPTESNESGLPVASPPLATGKPHTAVDAIDESVLVAIESKIEAAVNLLSPYAISGQPIPENIQAQAKALLADANALAGGDAVQYLQNAQLEGEAIDAQKRAILGEPPGNAPSYPVLYAALLATSTGTFVLRGETGPFGQYTLFVPRNQSLLQVSFFDPRANKFAVVHPRLRQGERYIVPHFELKDVDPAFPDSDHDGLPDFVEFIVGTNPNNPDSDGDGIPDGAEVAQGTNPLDNRPVRTGIIATAKTAGPALDVCAVNDMAAVATGAAGVAVFNVFNGMNPTIVAQVDTPGTAQAVDCAGSTVAVADGPSGLAMGDITEP